MGDRQRLAWFGLDDAGHEIVKLGQVKINGTIYYGMALLNSSGDVVALLGQLLDGTYGIALYNAFGVPITEVGPDGVTIQSSSGAVRAQLGLLANGDYGLQVVNTDGSSQEILPTISAFAAAQISTTSTSWVSLAGSPSLTATLGASGNAVVTVGAQIANGSTSAAGGGSHRAQRRRRSTDGLQPVDVVLQPGWWRVRLSQPENDAVGDGVRPRKR